MYYNSIVFMPQLIGILDSYKETRDFTVKLCQPLKPEDLVVQPILDVSPPKWHLGHSTWFFETFILIPKLKGYKPFHEDFSYFFNSYYENVGKRVLKADRGNLSRPTIEEILNYREYVDNEIFEFFKVNQDEHSLFLLELGINHEQQHQELMIYDIKYILGNNPLQPGYVKHKAINSRTSGLRFVEIPKGIYDIGHNKPDFFYDNEKAPHKVFLQSYKIADRLVTNWEYLDFIKDGGYKDFNLWLSDGWDWINEKNILCPLYWQNSEDGWLNYNLSGLHKLDLDAPVSHVSYYEAEAFARWAGKRLPTEFEWETAAKLHHPENNIDSNLLESKIFRPIPKSGNNMQFWGDCWEWTGSAYLPYPGYRKDKGALGEYNSKFMINQMVLRGGSFATPISHIRHTYRNFFHPEKRWLISGIRLAENDL